MKCEQCEKLRLRSTISSMGGSGTLLGWSPGHYDEDGNWVDHEDPNTYTYYWRCSNGHNFYTTNKSGNTQYYVDNQK